MASHLWGAEFSYSCIDSCTVEVRAIFYENCGSCAYISPNAFYFASDSSNCTPPAPLTSWEYQGLLTTEVTPLCPTPYPTNCLYPNSPYPGAIRHTHTRQYDICAASPCTFGLKWNSCCRNPALTSIPSPGARTIHLGATRLNAAAPCNSSPFFLNQPVTSICRGQSVVIPIGAVDPDGDSLSYRLGTCMEDSVNSTPYNPGYSPLQALGPGWSLSFNQTTGDLGVAALPGGNMGAFLICIFVDEWRNGQLVNTIQRDVMLIVQNCSIPLCGVNYASGKLYTDVNANCLFDSLDIPHPNRQVLVLPDSSLVPTDQNGDFHLFLQAGSHTVVPLPDPNGLWGQTCPSTNSLPISFPGQHDSIVGLDFAYEALASSPQMWVEVGGLASRPCFGNTFYISHCNLGSDTAFGAHVELVLDSNYSFDTSNLPLAGQNGSVLSFTLGDVPPGECGSFWIKADLACDNSLTGRTLCIEAHIFPDSLGVPPNPVWDGSSLEVVAACQGDSSVCFTVSNSGNPQTGSMQGPSEWHLYENGGLILLGQIQLCGGCDSTLCFPGNGNTFHLAVDQRPGHPGSGQASGTVELCGQPNMTLGQFNALPQDDAEAAISIHCLPVVNSFDPNSKQAFPTGVDPAFHYIDSTDVLDYMIDFQNTGTADAIRVVLIDTLPPELDLSTLVMGASSHPFSWELLSGSCLRFTFDNIFLPPASQDSAGSIGFVQFKVALKPGLGMGKRIENFADIFFDFNLPIRTNTIFHTVGWPPIILGVEKESAAEVIVYPNPTDGKVYVEVNGMEKGKQLSIELYNILGHRVDEGEMEAGFRFSADWGRFGPGIYIYRVFNGGDESWTGKIILY